MRLHDFITSTCVLAFFTASLPAQCLPTASVPRIAGTSGGVLPIETPDSLLDGAAVCDTAVYVMLESEATEPGTLTGDLAVPGRVDASSQPPASGVALQTAGLLVDTYLLHFDTGGTSAVVEGSITLEREIIGLITEGSRLLQTDLALGHVGTQYPPDPRRAVEWDVDPKGVPISYLVLSADRRTVAFRLRVDSSYLDQFRVVVNAGVPVCEATFGPGGMHFIGAEDRTHDGCRIIVRNATLTIDGAHDFHSVLVQSGGIISHSQELMNGQVHGLDLNVATDVTVESGGRIDATACGYRWDEGPAPGIAGPRYGGGGGHAGEGGRGQDGARSEGGSSYGSMFEPTDFGSGGGSDLKNVALGGRGGGAIRLRIAGMLTLDGSIEANGESRCIFANFPGGGAGGSVWITAGELVGTTGRVRVNGGVSGDHNCGDYAGGGGAGGRIAIYVNSLALPEDRFEAVGGGGWSSGESGGDAAAGTVFLSVTGQRAKLIIDNKDRRTDVRITTITEPWMLDGDLIVRGSARLGAAQGVPFDMTVTGNTTVSTGSAIYASFRGYDADIGPGLGVAGPRYGGGGGHGGEGGRGADGEQSEGGMSYGSLIEPTHFGSGGGSDLVNVVPGGRGGGAIRLYVGGTLTLNGTIEANGESRCIFANYPGGGAGGSVWITAGELVGTTGRVRVNGGVSGDHNCGDYAGGGGAGGRIAIYVNSLALPEDRFEAVGGGGWSSGESRGDAAAGTVYISTAGQRDRLIIDNGNVRTNVRVTMLPTHAPINADVIVREGGRLGVERGYPEAYWHISGDLRVETGSDVLGTGRGYGVEGGSGAGQGGFNWGGGAGHGGDGGNGRADDALALGGSSYGTPDIPITMGSGGAADPNTGQGSGEGGGALWIRIEGELSLRGNVDASGHSGGLDEAGGGAGGSVLLEAESITGVAFIRANGGNGNNLGGGGGGGRVAVYSCNLDPRLSFEVVGGGSSGGGTGEMGSLITAGSGIGANPQDATVEIGDEASFEALGLGIGLVYQWHKDGTPLTNGPTPHGSIISGASTWRMTITGVRTEDLGGYSVLVSNTCRQIMSDEAALARACPSDVNDDGVVNSQDFFDFLTCFFSPKCPEADFNRDGQINSQDFFDFLAAFFVGC